MKKIPLDISLNFDCKQIGALQAKSNLMDMMDKINIDYSDENGDISPARMLLHRNQVIDSIVSKIDCLNDYQKGYVSALLEFIEVNDINIDAVTNWKPSLITNKWQ